MSGNPIWSNMMPVKIFSDLVHFFGETGGEFKVADMQNAQISAQRTSQNRSVDTLASLSYGGAE